MTSLSSKSSSISTRDIQAIIEKLRNSKFREATKRNYQSVWKSFNKFFVRLDHKPRHWRDRITLYVGYLIDKKKQSSMIKSYLSAIKAVMLDNNIPWDSDQYLLSSLTRACRLENDQVKRRSPIKKKLLQKLLKQISILFGTQPYLQIMYQALFSTVYYRLFRIGELTYTISGHAISVTNVEIATKQKKIMFTLYTSKTHGKGNKPQKIKISSSPLASNLDDRDEPDDRYCPYQLLRRYLAIREGYYTENEQFFVFRDGAPVTAQQACKVLKTVIKDAGYNPTKFGTHSLQAGRSIDLLKLGFSIETIKDIGRWRSNAVFTYLKS